MCVSAVVSQYSAKTLNIKNVLQWNLLTGNVENARKKWHFRKNRVQRRTTKLNGGKEIAFDYGKENQTFIKNGHKVTYRKGSWLSMSKPCRLCLHVCTLNNAHSES